MLQRSARPAVIDGDETAGSARIDLFRFTVGGIGYAVPLALVAAVLERSVMVPNDAGSQVPWIGEILAGRQAIPVADAATLLLDAPRTLQDQLGKIVVLHGERPFALVVDDVRTSHSAQADQIRRLPWTCGPSWHLLVSGLVQIDEATVDLVIDDAALRLAVLDGAKPRREIDNEWVCTAELAVADVLDPVSMRDVVEVRLADDGARWALPLGYLRHVAEFRPPLPLPRSHEGVLGLLSWRRHPIPLIATDYWYGTYELPSPGTILVLKRVSPEADPDVPIAALRLHHVVGMHSVKQQDGNLVTLSDGSCLPLLDLRQMLIDVATPQ